MIKTNNLIVGTYNTQNIFTHQQPDLIVKAAYFKDFASGDNQFQEPIDIIGIQEARKDYVELLEMFITNYHIVGEQRYKGLLKNSSLSEGNNILTSNKTTTNEYSKTVWLAPKLQRPFNFSYLAPLPRIATYAIVTLKENNEHLLVINTHIHYRKGWSQTKQLEQLLKLIQKLKQKYKQTPMILTGDLNLQPHDYELQQFEEQIKKILTRIKIDSPTFHNSSSKKQLDYIFASDNIEIMDAIVDRNHPDIGNHYPVLAKIKTK